ncbi:MAG TPA: LuxR C-terminal-related transcriptional regulator [Acidimicrobiales bacterium]
MGSLDGAGDQIPLSSGSLGGNTPERALAHHVHRPRLLHALQGATKAPLTVVVAPAGTGKTSLLSDWSEETSTPTAWLSVNSGARGKEFWRGVGSALGEVCPGCGDRASATLEHSTSLQDPITQLLDDLHSADNSSSVLLVDDVHLVDGAVEITDSIERFVQHLPQWLHVVLASRTEPRLPLDRLRARGLVVEVRFRELQFSAQEATELLRLEHLPLSEPQVASVIERADGWAAALELAVPAARSTEAQAGLEDFDAAYERLLRDYVMREVLGSESPSNLEVLADLSVVHRISASLAEALVDLPHAAAWLEAAEARSIVAPVATPGWYGMHSLVRTVMQGVLATRFPDRVESLHRRAADWYERADEVPAALEHLLLADRPRRALRLLAARHAELYDGGNEEAIRKTISAIPAGVAMGDVDAIIELAWCRLLAGRHEFSEIVNHLEWRAEQTKLQEPARSRVLMLRAFDATIHGDWATGATRARAAQDPLGEHSWRDPLVRFSWNIIARDVALGERWDQTAGEVRELEAALARDPERRLAFEGTRAIGEALAGRPIDALRVIGGIRKTEKIANMTILSVELAMAEALAHREIGERQQAHEELRVLFDGFTEPMLYAKVAAGLELAQLHLDDGDPDGAAAAFDAVNDLTVSEGFGTGLRNWQARVGTVVNLACRRADEARRWATEVDDPFWSGVCMARVHLAEHDLAAAHAALATAVPRCPHHTVVVNLLQARVADSAAEAQQHAIAALECAVRNSMLQTVASEGPDVIAMLEPVAWDVPKLWMDRLRRAAGRSGIPVHASRLLDTLTDRERDVLRFLPSRLTVREIASELYISVNTLKFHLRVIYRKLNVRSRAEAVEIVRDMLNR